MGIAQSGVEVYDGAQHQFRVELTGGGMVASFEVPAGARQPASVQFMSVTFVRRP
jgi:hypothetical protein